jgi:hypothetical protein
MIYVNINLYGEYLKQDVHIALNECFTGLLFFQSFCIGEAINGLNFSISQIYKGFCCLVHYFRNMFP